MSVSVLVTGIGGGGHGEQIVKALRLADTPYRIVGADLTPLSAGRARVDTFALLPPAGDPGYLDEVIALARREDCVAVFHGSEREMRVLSEGAPRLKQAGVHVPVNRPGVLAQCQDKARGARHLRSHGLPTPDCCEIRNASDLDDVPALPLVLKPSVGGGGSANVFIVQTEEELRVFAHLLLEQADSVVAQAYVGTPEEEYTVGVLFGVDGELLGSIAIRRILSAALSVRMRAKNRTGRSDLGEQLVVSTGVSQGTVTDAPEIRRQCEQLAATFEPCAPMNIQCRVVDGVVMPFEINPRFSGTTSLRAMAGFNEPDILIRRDVLGEAVTVPQPRPVTILRGLEEFVV